MKKIMALAMSIMLAIGVTACSSSKVNEDETIVTVNGTEISAGQYQKTLALYKKSMESIYGPDLWEQEIKEGVKYKDQFKDMILQQMVDMELVYEKAKKDNLLPTKEEVDKTYKEFKKSVDSDKEYKKQLEELGIDEPYLIEQQEKDLAWQNYKENFDKKTKISDDEIKKYYEDNKKEFYKDEVKASHILISTLDENNKPLSEAKKKEAKSKAEDILKKAKAGEEFAKLAQENSDDKGSGAQGGDLGFFGKGQMVKPFEDAAFSMKKDEISDLVESEYGYHIIKVTDKVDKQLPLDEVKDSIKQTLLTQKFTQNIQNLSKDAKIEKKQDIIDKIKL